MYVFLLLLRRENGKIDKLTEDLYDTSRAIHCNEQMLREIKHHSRDQQKETVQVCVHCDAMPVCASCIETPFHVIYLPVYIHTYAHMHKLVNLLDSHCHIPT